MPQLDKINMNLFIDDFSIFYVLQFLILLYIICPVFEYVENRLLLLRASRTKSNNGSGPIPFGEEVKLLTSFPLRGRV